MTAGALESIRRSLGERALAGQCFCLGISGESVSADERRLIATMTPGGFILARRNLASYGQARGLIEELAALTLEASGIPPFFAADEEGGFVQQTDRFAAPAPSPMAVARAGRTAIAGRVAMATGERLRALGIPLAFAPVVDVNDVAANPVIGIRSFGANAAGVARFGEAYLAGFRAAGCFATAKHFPGHGSTSLDSHRDLPVLEHDRARLDEVELVPFRAAIAAGVAAIMSAHVAFPRVDPAGEMPATLVPWFMRRLLRERLGFDGLLVTDDLGMRAIRDQFPPREVARLARAAGIDVFLECLDPDLAAATWEGVLEGLSSGRIDGGELEASVDRVLRFKRDWLGLSADGQWGDAAVWRDGGRDFEEVDRELADLAASVARDAVTVRDDRPGHPWAPRTEERLGILVTAGNAGGSRFDAGLVSPGAARHRGRTGLRELPPEPSTGDLREAVEFARPWDRLLLVLFSRGALAPPIRDLVVELGRLERPLAVLSVLAPVELPSVATLHMQVASYGWSPAALAAAFDCLWGRREGKRLTS